MALPAGDRGRQREGAAPVADDTPGSEVVPIPRGEPDVYAVDEDDSESQQMHNTGTRG